MDARVGLWRRLSADELMLLNGGVGEDSWESLGLQGDLTSPFWRRSALRFLWKEWCWSWNSSTLATSCEELTHWKRLWRWVGWGAGGEGDDRGWDGWMASRTRWMWVWVNSGSWWWTGRPGVLRFMGSQRVGHDWATERNWRVIGRWFMEVLGEDSKVRQGRIQVNKHILSCRLSLWATETVTLGNSRRQCRLDFRDIPSEDWGSRSVYSPIPSVIAEYFPKKHEPPGIPCLHSTQVRTIQKPSGSESRFLVVGHFWCVLGCVVTRRYAQSSDGVR